MGSYELDALQTTAVMRNAADALRVFRLFDWKWDEGGKTFQPSVDDLFITYLKLIKTILNNKGNGDVAACGRLFVQLSNIDEKNKKINFEYGVELNSDYE